MRWVVLLLVLAMIGCSKTKTEPKKEYTDEDYISASKILELEKKKLNELHIKFKQKSLRLMEAHRAKYVGIEQGQLKIRRETLIENQSIITKSLADELKREIKRLEAIVIPRQKKYASEMKNKKSKLSQELDQLIDGSKESQDYEQQLKRFDKAKQKYDEIEKSRD